MLDALCFLLFALCLKWVIFLSSVLEFRAIDIRFVKIGDQPGDHTEYVIRKIVYYLKFLFINVLPVKRPV